MNRNAGLFVLLGIVAVGATASAQPTEQVYTGQFINSKGERGPARLVLEGTGRDVSGEWDGIPYAGTREGNVVTFEVRNIGGCRDYKVRAKLGPAKDTAALTYAVQDRCRQPSAYRGTEQLTRQAAAASPPQAKYPNVLGTRVTVKEVAGSTVYNGTWTRRPGTDIFDAVWGSVKDVIEMKSVDGNSIVLTRQGNGGRYYGTLSADGRRIAGGTASWYKPGWYWSGNTVDSSSGESSMGTSTNSQGHWKLVGRRTRWRQPLSQDQSVTYPADVPWGVTFPSADGYRDSTYTGREFQVTRTDRTDKTYASETLTWSKPPSTLAPGENYAFTMTRTGKGETAGIVSITSLSDENSLQGYQHVDGQSVVREYVAPAGPKVATEKRVICVSLTGAGSYFEYLYVYKWNSANALPRWQGQWQGSGYYVWKCDKCGRTWEPWCGLEWEWMLYMNDETWATCECGGNTVYLSKK